MSEPSVEEREKAREIVARWAYGLSGPFTFGKVEQRLADEIATALHDHAEAMIAERMIEVSALYDEQREAAVRAERERCAGIATRQGCRCPLLRGPGVLISPHVQRCPMGIAAAINAGESEKLSGTDSGHVGHDHIG